MTLVKFKGSSQANNVTIVYILLSYLTTSLGGKLIPTSQPKQQQNMEDHLHGSRENQQNYHQLKCLSWGEVIQGAGRKWKFSW